MPNGGRALSNGILMCNNAKPGSVDMQMCAHPLHPWTTGRATLKPTLYKSDVKNYLMAREVDGDSLINGMELNRKWEKLLNS